MKTVSPDGSGTYKTINEALMRVTDDPDSDKVIVVYPGIYKEKIRIITPGVTLIGRDPQTTIITFDDCVK